MKLYNTATKLKEAFKPLTSGKVGMYHCGPTVYGRVHIGNLRASVFADITRRTFEYLGYEVTQVMNITDVGHLTDDGDAGDDKMTRALRHYELPITLENMLKIGQKFTDEFVADLEALNIKMPHHLPKASEHLTEDEEIITKLSKKGLTYTTSDGIYFDTEQYPDYGKLGQVADANTAQARVDENSEKKNPRDFALWKFDEEKGFNSPLGKGFPGWHIECSGMSMKYLGETFDIHTGGIEHIGTHHNNEIAQSEGATGKEFVKYWLHNDHITVNNRKMAKSEGTGYTLDDIRDKGFDPMDLRYFYLQAHYRSPQNFTWEALEAAKSGREKLVHKVQKLQEKTNFNIGVINQSAHESFLIPLSNDFNTAEALGVLHTTLHNPTIADADKLATIFDFDRIFGLRLTEKKASLKIPEKVQDLLNQRQEARDNKDFEASDTLRDQIAKLGFEVKDTDKGQQISAK